ncbi:MAG: hypothetical protein JNL79_27520 [Myxococcales bacterium]|nr:hypothetical protein [Myxococcales bacterium]
MRRAGSMCFVLMALVALGVSCRRAQDRTDPTADEEKPVPGTTQSAVPMRVPKRHRPTPERCTDLPLRVATDASCSDDKDCAGREPKCVGGRCTVARCREDGDCLKGQMCQCGTAYAQSQNARPQHCLPAGCRTDADCGPSGYCSPTLDLECGSYRGISGWYCHGPRDACVDDEDCVSAQPGSEPRQGYCAYSLVAGRFVCAFAACAG